jgi:hypothetical protein
VPQKVTFPIMPLSERPDRNSCSSAFLLPSITCPAVYFLVDPLLVDDGLADLRKAADARDPDAAYRYAISLPTSTIARTFTSQRMAATLTL